MKGMKRASVQSEGFEGILYPGNGRKDKVLIVMSGSDGGMTLTKQESGFYHRNGIPALALALFKTKQTPRELSRVPVEYVERAIAWLKQQGYEKIGIDGTSKGSEMALVAASLFPALSCVIVRVPSHFVSEGLSGSGKDKAPSGPPAGAIGERSCLTRPTEAGRSISSKCSCGKRRCTSSPSTGKRM